MDGLKIKYNVYKAEDGSIVNDCFVLRPDKDLAARKALLSYAEHTLMNSLQQISEIG